MVNVIPTYSTGFARSAAESAYPEMWRDLVGLWSPYLGNSGTTLRDWSGHKNHGTLSGFNYTAASGWSASERGVGLLFDGTDDYVDCGNANVLNITDVITITCWFNPTTVSASQDLISKYDVSPSAMNYLMLQINTAMRFYTGGQPAIYINTGLTVGKWTFFAGVHDGSDTFLYVDDLGRVAAASPASPVSSPTNLLFGRRENGANDMAGMLDDVRIYNRALTATEIAAIYHGANPLILKSRVYSFAAGISMPLVMQQMDQFNGGAVL